MPILVFLDISVLHLGPMYATDSQTDRRQTASSLNAPASGAGYNNEEDYQSDQNTREIHRTRSEN